MTPSHALALRDDTLPAVARPSLQVFRRAADLVSGAIGMEPDRVHAPKSHPERRARALAAYLTVVAGNRTANSTATAIGVTAPAVRKMLRAIEDRRDDPAIDARLNELEEALACQS